MLRVHGAADSEPSGPMAITSLWFTDGSIPHLKGPLARTPLTGLDTNKTGSLVVTVSTLRCRLGCGWCRFWFDPIGYGSTFF